MESTIPAINSRDAKEKSCQTCGRQIRGRTDKRFCNDACRNSFHNQVNAVSNNYIRQINHLLQKNRRILASLIPGNCQKAKIALAQLAELGYHFQYYTHERTNRKGNAYRFCYDYGYQLLSEDVLMIVYQPSVESTIFAG
jgi:predicted nucleic acid-binding Zn ribbon protein